jgi:hypothetical protein
MIVSRFHCFRMSWWIFGSCKKNHIWIKLFYFFLKTSFVKWFLTFPWLGWFNHVFGVYICKSFWNSHLGLCWNTMGSGSFYKFPSSFLDFVSEYFLLIRFLFMNVIHQCFCSIMVCRVIAIGYPYYKLNDTSSVPWFFVYHSYHSNLW